MGLHFLIDADEVLLSFVDPLLAALGVSQTSLDVTQWDVFELLERWYGPALSGAGRTLLSDGTFWLTQPAVAGAAYALSILMGAGASFEIVTAPWRSCASWNLMRKAALWRLFGVAPGLVVEAEDKARVHGDVLIDDKLANVVSWSAVHPRGASYLFTRPHNAADVWPRRISWDAAGYAELAKLVMAR